MDGCPEAFKAQSFIDALAEVRIKDVLAMEWLPQRERGVLVREEGNEDFEMDWRGQGRLRTCT